MEPGEIARELGAGFIVQGSLRKSSERVRITAQLVDAASGNHLWAERYDRLLDDIFALQDELTMSVVGAIEPTLRRAEIERVRRRRPDSLDAYDLYLHALPHYYAMTRADNGAALTLLMQALAIDPDYAVAAVTSGWRVLKEGADAWQDPDVLESIARSALRVTLTEGQRLSIGAKLISP